MPVRHMPRTNAKRISAMRAIKSRLEYAPDQPHPFREATVAWLIAFYPQYVALAQQTTDAKARQIGSTALVKPLRDKARLWLGHGYTSIINATVRGSLPKATLALYGLPTTAQGGPNMRSEQAILSAAQLLANGEAHRVASGGEPLAFPSLAEIMLHADAFKDANTIQSNLKDDLTSAQRALKLANKEADKLIKRLWNEVETAFDTGDAPSMRRKARRWGVIYIQSPSDPPAAETNSAMGHITDRATGKALRQVKVTVAGTDIHAKSNANGRYALPLMDAGTYELLFKRKGYATGSVSLVVTDEEMTLLNVTMDSQ